MLHVDDIRRQFPALQREQDGRPVVFFDGPAGSQVPRRVAEAVSRYLLSTNANHGGLFATARESDELLDDAHRTLAALLGAADPDCISFGPNMTTLTFALSRALGRTWAAGDEIVVTRSDHDANVSPWVLASRDAGATVHHVGVNTDGTLDQQDFQSKLSGRTKLVALGYASNATGTIHPLSEMITAAHAVGALVFVDAVHYAPHRLIDVQRLECDFLACSAYKFFGPHVGVLYGKRELLEELPAYKLRPAPDSLPGKWMTGTQSHEGIVGAAEAVKYLAGLAGESIANTSSLRQRLISAFDAIVAYETDLMIRLLEGLKAIDGVAIWGLTDRNRMDERVPTVSITHRDHSPESIAAELGKRGTFVWHGNHYALALTEALGLEPDGTLRIGLLHYNTADEVDRLLEALRQILDR